LSSTEAAERSHAGQARATGGIRARLSGMETALVLSVLAVLLGALLLLESGGGGGREPGGAIPRTPLPQAVASGLHSPQDSSLEEEPAAAATPLEWSQPRCSASGNAFWGDDVVGPFRQIWEIQTGYELFGSPALVDGVLYFGCNDSRFRAVSASTGQAVWAYSVQCGICGEAAVDSQSVYFGGQDGYIYCIDRSSGSRRWSAGLGYHILGGTALFADTLVAAGNSRGGVAALSRSDGEVVWNGNVEGLVLGPAVADSMVVVTTESGEVASWSFGGESLWRRDLQHQASAPSVVEGKVLVGLADGTVRCLSAADGSDLWTAELHSGGLRAVVGRPVAAGGYALVGTSHSRLARISVEDGSVLWSREMENWVQVPPAVGDSTAYVSCDDKRLHIVSLADGSTIDSLEMGSYSGTAPTVSGGVVYLGTAGGRMTALGGSEPLPADSQVAAAPVAPDTSGRGEQP